MDTANSIKGTHKPICEMAKKLQEILKSFDTPTYGGG